MSEPKLKAIFISCVKLRLMQLEMGKSKLARKTGMSANTIYSLLSGKQKGTSFENIDKIAKALHCEPKDLFDIDQRIYAWKLNNNGGNEND